MAVCWCLWIEGCGETSRLSMKVVSGESELTIDFATPKD